MMFIKSWSFEGVFNRPAELEQPVVEHPWLNAQFLRPLHQWESFAVKCQESSFRCVAGAKGCGCPPAVHWPAILDAFKALPTRIISVVINAINHQPIWAGPHVLNEVGGVVPARTKLNAASPVAVIMILLWIVTSGFDAEPYVINTAFRQPVLAEDCASDFNFSAPARSRVSACQRPSFNVSDLSAFTMTSPEPSVPSPVADSENFETTEYSAGQVSKSSSYFDTLSIQENNRFSTAHGDNGLMLAGWSLFHQTQPALIKQPNNKKQC